MAKPNGRGGWDLTDNDVAEVMAASFGGDDGKDREHLPRYETADAVDDALAAVKARWDHGDAPYDPDILALIRAAETMRAKLYGPVADDPMPVFVIKAKDAFAVSAVWEYQRLCESRGLDAQAAQVRLARVEMSEWRERNPGAVKLPDHPHVPVA